MGQTGMIQHLVGHPWWQTPISRRVLTGVRALVAAAVILFLFRHLERIGWHAIWRALPVSPFFYIAFIGGYILLPATEVVIYGQLWGRQLVKNIGVFFRKMVYNDVFDYSGEAYLALWARRTLGLSARDVLSTVKDVNLLSGLASNLVTLLLVGAFLATGQLQMLFRSSPHLHDYLAISLLFGGALVALVILMRHRLFHLGLQRSLTVLALHLGRVVGGQLLIIGQWVAALPQAPASVWLLFLSANMVLTRIPFLPNRALMTLGLGLALSKLVPGIQMGIAGMVLATGGLTLMVSLGVFMVTSLAGSRPQAVPHEA